MLDDDDERVAMLEGLGEGWLDRAGRGQKEATKSWSTHELSETGLISNEDVVEAMATPSTSSQHPTSVASMFVYCRGCVTSDSSDSDYSSDEDEVSEINHKFRNSDEKNDEWVGKMNYVP